MTGTLPTRTDAIVTEPTTTAPPASPTPLVELDQLADVVGAIPHRSAGAVRPWSALVCGLAEDRTLLVVDWLLLACRDAGLVAQAVPLAGADASLHGMYVEVAVDPGVEQSFGDVPWGAVDLLVAGEHLELMRAVDAGHVDPDVTTVVASCRRDFTSVERVVAPQYVLSEREIDAAVNAAARAYHAFDGHEVARWYHLPSAAQPGLLLGAIHGTGITGLDEERFASAIAQLGIDPQLHAEAFRRGSRLGRREGGRVRRLRTAYQFTRRRRAQVDHRSRRDFEALVERAGEFVHPDHVPALQEAIFLLCEFQDAAWATQLVDHVADLVAAERALLGRDPGPDASIVPDAVRALATLLVWPDAAWVANRKRRRGRLAQLRSAHGLTRHDAYDLVDYVPLDERDRAQLRGWRRNAGGPEPSTPPLLQAVRVERIRTTRVSGALRLRRMAAAARRRAGSARHQLELDTAATWLEALHDALRTDHELARIVARSGTLVQGAGAVREAHRATAHAFWGRIVRQSIGIDRIGAPGGEPQVARRVVPFVWEQLCRSGSLALWEYAAQVLGIALAHSRGVPYEQTLGLADALCTPHRPVEGR